jgi:hypothetical protein
MGPPPPICRLSQIDRGASSYLDVPWQNRLPAHRNPRSPGRWEPLMYVIQAQSDRRGDCAHTRSKFSEVSRGQHCRTSAASRITSSDLTQGFATCTKVLNAF